MKLTKFANLIVLGLVLTVAAAGCRKRPSNVTDLPGRTAPKPTDITEFKPLTPSPAPTNSEPFGTPLTPPTVRETWARNAEILKVDTVYFDFDSSVVKSSEKSKVAAVADYMKANAQNALEVDGHCDERGTEEYNRSLGERRALALREELIRLGVNGELIDTVTYGKDRPAEPGHDEAAWKKNRRGEFLVETPPAKP